MGIRLCALGALVMAACHDAPPAAIDAMPPDDAPADTTAPVVTIAGAPAAVTMMTGADLVVRCDDPTCTLDCALDTGAVDCAHASFSGLPDGVHVFVAHGRDLAGNVGTAMASWTVDTTAPTTTFTTVPMDPTNVVNAMHAFACDEPSCTFECSRDGGAFASCTSPVAATVGDGAHTLDVRATDAVGNVGSPASDGWVVDTVPPTVSITSFPAALTNQASADFAFSCDEACTFECSRDGGAFAACTSPTTLSGLGTAAHTFDVRATDLAGNPSASPASYGWTVDTTPPVVTITNGPLATTQYTSADLSFTCNETPCTLTCSLDGAAFASCTSTATFGPLGNGAHAIVVHGADQAGNVGSATRSFTVDPTLDVIAVASGVFHACAIRSNGTLWCWGYNAQHQVGDGTTTNRSTPAQVGTATTWTALAAGYNHTCGVQSNGTLWCWGDNAYGQIGDGTTTDRTAPTQVGTATNWAKLAGGDNHTCAIATDHTLWCWGQNGSSQLGDASTTNRPAPTKVGTDTDWDYATLGAAHSCAVKLDKTLWCWGQNGSAGVLGDGSTMTRASPVQILTNVAAASAGEYYTCALHPDNTLYCWGSNFWGNLGDGTETDHSTPHQVPGTWTTITANGYHACAQKTDATLWCWGNDNDGELGNGVMTATQVPTPTPQAVTLGTGWVLIIDGNGDETYGLRADGTLWSWGYNNQGALGNGDNVNRSSPAASLL